MTEECLIHYLNGLNVFSKGQKKRHRKPIKTKTENGDQERKGWKGNIKKGKKKKGYTKRREK